jgi:transcriptional regulator with XRE-family HTH domain
MKSGNILRRERIKRGLSANDVFRMTNVPLNRIYQYERGGLRNPNPHIVARLADLLGVPFATAYRAAQRTTQRGRVAI